MAKTDVILIKNVEGLGAESDQVNVATGYARNFLLPQGLAIPLTQGNERRLAALRKQRQDRELREAKDAKELAASFKHLMLIIKAKTGETGKMYGSVTPANIIDQLQEQFELLHNDAKIPHEVLSKFPKSLLGSAMHTQPRLQFLRAIGRDQFDPSLPNYISPEMLTVVSDAEFCDKSAKCSEELFDKFLKTL